MYYINPFKWEKDNNLFFGESVSFFINKRICDHFLWVHISKANKKVNNKKQHDQKKKLKRVLKWNFKTMIILFIKISFLVENKFPCRRTRSFKCRHCMIAILMKFLDSKPFIVLFSASMILIRHKRTYCLHSLWIPWRNEKFSHVYDSLLSELNHKSQYQKNGYHIGLMTRYISMK